MLLLVASLAVVVATSPTEATPARFEVRVSTQSGPGLTGQTLDKGPDLASDRRSNRVRRRSLMECASGGKRCRRCKKEPQGKQVRCDRCSRPRVQYGEHEACLP